MSSNLDQIMKLDVPVIVRLAERQLPLGEVLRLVPGAIIELEKSSDGELDLLVNNRVIGSGTAVKVGENFGIRVTFLGNLKERVDKREGAAEELSAADAARLADELLAGQV